MPSAASVPHGAAVGRAAESLGPAARHWMTAWVMVRPYPCGGPGEQQIREPCRTRRGTTMIEDHELDYASLARLLDQAAREHRDLAATTDDPLERYQVGTNVDFFTVARTAATEYLTRGRQLSLSLGQSA